MGDEDDDLDQYAQLEPEDTLEDRGVVDVLDEGYSPPERPWAAGDYGETAREAAEHEDLDHRLARELPDPAFSDADEGDGLGDASDTDGELLATDEVGGRRAGRLVQRDEDPLVTDDENWAVDAGIDGAGASAEEAAVHVIDDDR
ncbi:hypothetical protein PSU4_02050 [Pseudonocardia sulfidoxydans NBRC 16205]|uniref:DUF5709 domain-containing protein n=1 Tax=Pseudonocardia sulfidoxydans NBRC 16205 TaxID=1223511 RepID=A0A511D8Y6_9PSEU|nr:DUF5709 domain-containing protein [Pseudonocardia sulfidoxydans]GEL21251.1 hypothetical protein PSU4_02050 [Pseudonocardia sulfidoxydans NBRC 16205]